MRFSSRRQRNDQKVRQPHSTVGMAGKLYQRSRTLTGAISSHVSAVAEKTAILRSPRLEEHDLRETRRRVSLLLVVVLGTCVAIFLFIDTMILGLEVLPQSGRAVEYKKAINRYFDQNPLQRSSLTLDTASLLDDLRSNMAEVQSVTVSGKDGFASFKFDVRSRVPVAKWQLGSKQYFVDSNGVAFDYSDSDTRKLLSIKDESGLPVAAQQIASRSMMQFIGQVVGYLRINGAGTVTEVIIPPATLKQVDIILENRPYRIKLNIERPPNEQAIDILNTLKYLDKQGIVPLYIDSRVEGKAFYKT